ncbi:hypothetical protein [Herbaspirillum sp. 1130]|uniref:aldose epimerase family protein n=1 Tax=Herbaspirillum sp. 1130 TaxID=2806562 RepID=UPI001AE366EF|nr:hypothetical protein [Herbaspirillum sp. 1130]MBP1318272.1 aldose 1-epimerase [Herbaspirillum sp. 1130]
MDTRILENASLRAEFLPEFGGRMARLLFKGPPGGQREVLQPYVQTSFDALAWPKCGMYPLAPYSNRIRDARLPFAGQVHVLPPHPAASPHTLHGCAHTLAWRVSAQDPRLLEMDVHYTGPHWPWPLYCRQRVVIGDGWLECTLEVRNLNATRSMPVGGGLHPFLSADGLREMCFVAGRRWQHDAQCLPDGLSTPLLGGQRWSPSMADEAEQLGYFSQWDGQMQLQYDQGILQLSAGQGLSHLVMFIPRGAPYVCVEPVSHLANAFAMPQLDPRDSGVALAAPGQSVRYTMRLAWQPN